MSEKPALHEKELLADLKNGNGQALAMLYKLHWQTLFLSAYNILRDKRACEDIIQELFLQLWLKRDTLAVRDSLSAYLATAVRYQVFHYIRKAAKAPVLTENLPSRSYAESPDEVLLKNDLRRRVAEAVSGLPEKCRLIYTLSREEQLSHKEIAARLNITTKTVENQLTIALRRLRCNLQDCAAIQVPLIFCICLF